jgi:CRP-like cAMP-binding protein
MSQTDEQDELISFTRGDFIFHEGERGGDLFIIERGEVEIIQLHDGQEVKLSEMKVGEILGVMTCLNDDPRMASARAKTGVKARKIPHARIKDQMAKMPLWLNVVLKEFSIRLSQMNKSYSQSTVKLKQLEKSQLSSIYTAMQMTSAIPTLSKYIERRIGDETFVVMEDLFSILEQTLCQSKSDLDKIFNAMLASGLAKVEINSDTKSIVLNQASIKSIFGFHQFLRDSQNGKAKRIANVRLSNKESRIMMALCKLAKSLYANANENCELAFETIKEHFKSKAGVELDPAVIEIAYEYKMIKKDGSGDDASISFVPNKLERMVRCLEAMRRLRIIDEGGEEDRLAV